MHLASESTSPEKPSAAARLRVLVVDDEPMVRRVCKALLELLGHEVIEAGNGFEALRRVGDSRPDAVLLDMLMPEKDGVETLREIRAIDAVLPIIAMSGGSRIDAALCLRFASNLGAPLVLLKPFTADELDAALAQVIQRRADTQRP